MKQNKSKQNWFTVIEVLIAIIGIAALAGVISLVCWYASLSIF